MGISPYMDSGRFLNTKASLEVQTRFLHWRGPGSLTESSYMAGLRWSLFRYRQVSLNAKALIGKAHLTLANHGAAEGSYLAYAPGGLLEYRLNPRMFLRADYEYQFWPTFRGSRTATTDGTGALTPNGFSLGVSYALP